LTGSITGQEHQYHRNDQYDHYCGSDGFAVSVIEKLEEIHLRLLQDIAVFCCFPHNLYRL